MNTIINVMKSLVEFNGFSVTRFDIQGYVNGKYVGYLYTKESEVITIREDGSFEIK